MSCTPFFSTFFIFLPPSFVQARLMSSVRHTSLFRTSSFAHTYLNPLFPIPLPSKKKSASIGVHLRIISFSRSRSKNPAILAAAFKTQSCSKKHRTASLKIDLVRKNIEQHPNSPSPKLLNPHSSLPQILNPQSAFYVPTPRHTKSSLIRQNIEQHLSKPHLVRKNIEQHPNSPMKSHPRGGVRKKIPHGRD